MKGSYSYDWMNNFNRPLMLDLNWFLLKVNERANIANGFIHQQYEAVNRLGNNDFGLGENVDYFHPSITLDDRMRYICQVISTRDMSKFNILGNTIISHFYGARGVHQVITGSNDPYDCFVDFDRVANDDKKYIAEIRNSIDVNFGLMRKPIWGTTELHTPIQTSARNFCRLKYSDPQRKFHAVDVIEWVASFKNSGLYESMIGSDHLKDTFTFLTKERGIGEYYGFHCATSTSALPFMKYHHDQRFVAPGPGAKDTIQRLWPNAPKKLYPEAVYFMRENSDEIGLTEGVLFHPESWNIDNIFDEPQDSLKYYGTEVLCCQFSIYLNIRNNKAACDRRKVSRLESQSSLKDIFQ